MNEGLAGRGGGARGRGVEGKNPRSPRGLMVGHAQGKGEVHARVRNGGQAKYRSTFFLGKFDLLINFPPPGEAGARINPWMMMAATLCVAAHMLQLYTASTLRCRLPHSRYTFRDEHCTVVAVIHCLHGRLDISVSGTAGIPAGPSQMRQIRIKAFFLECTVAHPCNTMHSTSAAAAS